MPHARNVYSLRALPGDIGSGGSTAPSSVCNEGGSVSASRAESCKAAQPLPLALCSRNFMAEPAQPTASILPGVARARASAADHISGASISLSSAASSAGSRTATHTTSPVMSPILVPSPSPGASLISSPVSTTCSETCYAPDSPLTEAVGCQAAGCSDTVAAVAPSSGHSPVKEAYVQTDPPTQAPGVSCESCSTTWVRDRAAAIDAVARSTSRAAGRPVTALCQTSAEKTGATARLGVGATAAGATLGCADAAHAAAGVGNACGLRVGEGEPARDAEEYPGAIAWEGPAGSVEECAPESAHVVVEQATFSCAACAPPSPDRGHGSAFEACGALPKLRNLPFGAPHPALASPPRQLQREEHVGGYHNRTASGLTPRNSRLTNSLSETVCTPRQSLALTPRDSATTSASSPMIHVAPARTPPRPASTTVLSGVPMALPRMLPASLSDAPAANESQSRAPPHPGTEPNVRAGASSDVGASQHGPRLSQRRASFCRRGTGVEPTTSAPQRGAVAAETEEAGNSCSREGETLEAPLRSPRLSHRRSSFARSRGQPSGGNPPPGGSSGEVHAEDVTNGGDSSLVESGDGVLAEALVHVDSLADDCREPDSVEANSYPAAAAYAPGGAASKKPCNLTISTSGSCLGNNAAAGSALPTPQTGDSTASSSPRIPGGALLDWSPKPILERSRSACIRFAMSVAKGRFSPRASGRYSARHSDRLSAHASDLGSECGSPCDSGRLSARCAASSTAPMPKPQQPDVAGAGLVATREQSGQLRAPAFWRKVVDSPRLQDAPRRLVTPRGRAVVEDSIKEDADASVSTQGASGI